jgi:hypothetical protein
MATISMGKQLSIAYRSSENTIQFSTIIVKTDKGMGAQLR